LGIVPMGEDWIPITHANQGLCGGMVFTVMDYFHYHLLPPLDSSAPSRRDDELFQFVRDRLWESFDVTGRGHRWLGYSSPHYPNGDEGVIQALGFTRGRSWVTYRDEWPQIRDDIEQGHLSPIGLVQTTSLDIGQNHQVMAYAYRQSGQLVQLWIYDPNDIDTDDRDDLYLQFDVTDTAGEVHADRYRRGALVSGQPRIWCIFRMDGYSPKAPPRGRPAESMTVNEAVRRVLGGRRPGARLTSDVSGLTRPLSVRSWMRTL
jgi:hypothetical protein